MSVATIKAVSCTTVPGNELAGARTCNEQDLGWKVMRALLAAWIDHDIAKRAFRRSRLRRKTLAFPIIHQDCIAYPVRHTTHPNTLLPPSSTSRPVLSLSRPAL